MIEILIPIAIIVFIAVVAVIIRAVNVDHSKASERQSFYKDNEDFNKSQVWEIIKYVDRYYIRKPHRMNKWAEPYYCEYPKWVSRKGGEDVPEGSRWDFDFDRALAMSTLEGAKDVLESLSIKYIDPNHGEVVYKEEVRSSPPENTIMELIEAVKKGDVVREVEILKALGYNT